MHILMLSGSYPLERTGGAEIQTLILAKGLVECGYDVTYLAANTNTESKSRINNLNVIKIPGMDKVGIAQHKQDLENAILESRPDICYIRSFKHLMWVIPFCKNIGIPVISMSCQGLEVTPFLTKSSLREFISGMKKMGIIRHFLSFRSIQFSDMHICITKSLREGIRHWYPDKPIRVIYNGHQIPPFEDVHKKFYKRIIWVNNVKRFKRPEIFIDLASCLPDIEFAMIGRIEDKGRYNNHIRSLIQNGPDNLKSLGALPFDKVNTEISMSDILIYTSTPLEGFGNSFIQAWMRGVPTISLNFDPDGIIERERIGHCSSNFSQLVKGTRELIDNPLALLDMGQRARSYAETKHDYNYMVSQYDLLFRELNNQKSK